MREDILVVSSWSEAGAREYGERWKATIKKHWLDVPWWVVLDESFRYDAAMRECLERLAADPVTGNHKDIHKGCAKWARKVFALNRVRVESPTRWLLWIDGDVEFLAPPTDEFFAAVCDDNWDVSYLGRPWTYASETGFVAYNMKSARTRMLLAMMRDTYLTGYFRELDEWGDAAVFDHCKSLIPGLMDKNLCMHLVDRVGTIDQGGMHVWPQTVLAPFMRHNKGPRRKTVAYG